MKRVAKAILYKNNKVLLQLRDNKPNIPFPNQWSLFGGKIEENETAEQCLIREIKEELNADIKNIKLIKKKIRLETGNQVEDNIFSAEITTDETNLELNEGAKMQFFKLEELNKLESIVPHYKTEILKFLFK